jgi:hypothetical protein
MARKLENDKKLIKSVIEDTKCVKNGIRFGWCILGPAAIIMPQNFHHVMSSHVMSFHIYIL